MKSLMNRYVKLLSFLPGICLIAACAGYQIKGYEINGSAPLPEFEGKMVYMKDASSGQPVSVEPVRPVGSTKARQEQFILADGEALKGTAREDLKERFAAVIGIGQTQLEVVEVE